MVNKEERPAGIRAAAKLVILCCLCFIVTSNLRCSQSFQAEFGLVPIMPLEESSTPKESLKTAWLPADIETSETALAALRKVQAAVPERNFHEATHVLYDLRTHLGSRPVKYLEIGSYTGISASLMLSHPFPTFVTMVDPCILPKSHFNGTMTQEETILKTLTQLHPHKDWLLRVGFSPDALPAGETFDIIFIDGDHSTDGVWKDYSGTLDLLRPGGFMVFDDYLDAVFSGEVRGAVDDIAKQTSLVPYGTPRNIHGIHLETNSSFINEYIFQKPGGAISAQPIPGMESATPVLCVTVTTYRRNDFSTPQLLERMWEMLEHQSYPNWKLYLTGDHYGNETEWKSFSFYNDPRASLFDLPEAGERGKLVETELWLNAGAVARNNAIERLVSDGYEWNVHLDDDDTWSADHLQNIVLGIREGATFVMTECQYGNTVLPIANKLPNISHTVLPALGGNVHSSVAFNAAKIPSRYKSRPGWPADGYMWERMKYEENFVPVFVPIMSCTHMTERSTILGSGLFRKITLRDVEVPPGWYNDESISGDPEAYYALATNTLPPNVSSSCSIVVGPNTATEDFRQMKFDEIPFFIREVKAFTGLPVWKKRDDGS